MQAHMNSEIREKFRAFVIAGVSFKHFRRLTEALSTNLTRLMIVFLWEVDALGQEEKKNS